VNFSVNSVFFKLGIASTIIYDCRCNIPYNHTRAVFFFLVSCLASIDRLYPASLSPEQEEVNLPIFFV